MLGAKTPLLPLDTKTAELRILNSKVLQSRPWASLLELLGKDRLVGGSCGFQMLGHKQTHSACVFGNQSNVFMEEDVQEKMNQLLT